MIVRGADMAGSPQSGSNWEFVRCDTSTPDDARRAVAGCDAVIHLAAWHCAHVPPVSDATIFRVNVDGSYNVLEACREQGVKAVVFASSMAYGFGSVYSVTKVIGEDLWRAYSEMTGASVALLRYHDFVPKPYLAFGTKLLRNGVDARDVASATVAAMDAALGRKFRLFTTIIHTAHGMPSEVVADFRQEGVAWCESRTPGAAALIDKYALSADLPDSVEQHDLSEAERLFGWYPQISFTAFLEDLKRRDAAGQDVRSLWAPGQLSED